MPCIHVKQAVIKLTSEERKDEIVVIQWRRERPPLVVTWALGQTTCIAEEIRKDNSYK